jgi:hypothetical protein
MRLKMHLALIAYPESDKLMSILVALKIHVPVALKCMF